MGSIECISICKTPYTMGNQQKLLKVFRCLREDFDKLPKDDDMASGSSVLFVDTGEYAEYLSYNKTWYLLPTEVKGNTNTGGISYSGTYNVIPKASQQQVLATANRTLSNNITIEKIPYSETSNESNGKTVNIAKEDK